MDHQQKKDLTGWNATLDAFLARIITRLQEIYRDQESDRAAVEFALRQSASSIGSLDCNDQNVPDNHTEDQNNNLNNNNNDDDLDMEQQKVAPLTVMERLVLIRELEQILEAYRDDQSRMKSGPKIVEHSVTEWDVDRVYHFISVQGGRLSLGHSRGMLDCIPWLWHWVALEPRRIVHLLFDVIAIHEERIQRLDRTMQLVGFKNAGNSCYISSLITAMFASSSQFDYILSFKTFNARRDSIQNRQSRVFSELPEAGAVKSLIQILGLIVHRMRQGRLIGNGTISLLKQELFLAGFYHSIGSRESQQDVLELYQWLMNKLGARALSFQESLFHGGDANPKDDLKMEKEFAVVLSIDDHQENPNSNTSSFSDMLSTSQRKLSSGIQTLSKAMMRRISSKGSGHSVSGPSVITTSTATATNTSGKNLEYFINKHFFANRISGLLRPVSNSSTTTAVTAAEEAAATQIKVDAWKMIQMVHDPFSPVNIFPIALKRYLYDWTTSSPSPTKDGSRNRMSFLLNGFSSPLSPISSTGEGAGAMGNGASSLTSTTAPGTSASQLRKDEKRIEIPLTINFTPYIIMHPNLAGMMVEQDILETGAKIVEWRLHLKTVICHSGSKVVDEGHYTCYVAPHQQSSKQQPWLKMDDLARCGTSDRNNGEDCYVKNISFEEWNKDVSKHAYLLFYEIEGISEKQLQMEKDEELARSLREI